MIENGFVYAINKYSLQRAKIEARKDKKTRKIYDILRKYDTCLPDLAKEKLTKAEYKIVVDYITKVCNYPLRLYPHLQ
jgi:acyl-[acyl carrier protein]--UDP-N-acetylglucosamine O-acyltransferase